MIVENPKCPTCGQSVYYLTTVREIWTVYSIEDEEVGTDEFVKSYPADDGEDKLFCQACEWEGTPSALTLTGEQDD